MAKSPRYLPVIDGERAQLSASRAELFRLQKDEMLKRRHPGIPTQKKDKKERKKKKERAASHRTETHGPPRHTCFEWTTIPSLRKRGQIVE